MANEIRVNFGMTASLHGVTVVKNPAGLQLTWTGGAYVSQTISVGTTYEALPAAADLGTPGLMFIFNAGAESVALSFDSGATAHLTLKASEFQFFRVAAAVTPDAIQAKSLGDDPVLVEYLILSD